MPQTKKNKITQFMEDSAMEWKNPVQGGKNPIPLATRHYGLEHGL